MERTKYPGIYRRGESYAVVVSYRDGFGRKRQKWVTSPTLALARDARRTLLNDLERGLRPDGSRMTVEEFSAVWMTDVKSRLRPITARNYKTLLDCHIVPAIGGLKLRDVDRRHLKDLYAPLSPSLAARCHSALSAMFSFAVKEEGALSMNPCATVRRPKYTAPEARHLEPQEASRMLRAAEGSPIEPGILLGLAGGLRIAEVLTVRWGDLDNDLLTVRRSYWGETKSGRIRSLTLPASARDALRRCKRVQAEALLSVGVRQDESTSLLADPIGRPAVLNTFKVAFRAFCKEHGFDVTFHSLRHSNTVALLTAGVDVQTVAGRLGNSPRILLATYSHYIRSADKAAAERLEAMLR